MERASLSTEQLIALGHTKNDIALLKAYNGERIVENSPVIAASPTCRGNIVKVNLSNNGYAIQFKYTFTWSACPFFQRTDKVAVKWVAANENGAVPCRVTSRSGLVNYYSDITGSRVETISKTPSEDENSTFSGRQFSYEVNKPYSDPSIANWIWAKSGSMTIKLEPLANSSQSSTPVQISAVDAYGAVGHQYSGLDIEIGIDDDKESTSVSFSFTPVENVDKTGIAHYIIPKDSSATPAS